MLEPFTAEHEVRAFETMAGGMLATLVKLALPGRRPGLRTVTLQSTRGKRMLTWRQDAGSLRSSQKGVSVIRRVGRLLDSRGGAEERRDFAEMEFATSVQIPDKYADRAYPAYFKIGPDAIRIAVSVPLTRRRLDQGRPGHFHYPLQAPSARTGCLIGVSAPFELDNDRSNLLDNKWNEWLMDEAARLTVELLTSDWFDRFGPGALQALDRTYPAIPSRFIEEVERRLREQACWPTRATGSGRYAKASQVVVVADPALDGFLSDSRYLDPTLIADPSARKLALTVGARSFTLSSLIRLRCAGADEKGLKTKLQKGEANWHFENYETALLDEARQAKMAAALTVFSRRLSQANRDDLRSTASTLTAAGTLRPAGELVAVPPGIWNVCPEPIENRLHPALVQHRTIAGLCSRFDEQTWMVAAADRPRASKIEEVERQALYARLLDEKTHIGRRALTAIRKSPVMRNHRGEWTAPADMVMLKGEVAKFMAPVVSAPSKEMVARADLLARLRIRKSLETADLIAGAAQIAQRPERAERFERLLADNQRLIIPAAAKQLFDVPFLRGKSGVLAAPSSLHLDTTSNRICIADDSRLVAGSNDTLYRRLQVREHPSVDTLLKVIASARSRSEPPARPEIIYSAIMAGLVRERRPKFEFERDKILWVDGAYHAPADVLVGTHISHVFDGAVPVLRRSDELSLTYVALGAKAEAKEEHWARFFKLASEQWDGKPVTDHQTHHAATTRPEHHLRRIDRCLAVAVAGKKGAANGDRRSRTATRHKRHHRGPNPARGVFQAGVEAQGGRSRKIEPARAQIGCDVCSPDGSRCLPHHKRRLAALQGVGVGFIGNAILALAGEATQNPPGRFPKTALAKDDDHVPLIASGMAAHEHLAIYARADRKARHSILMRRAARHPCCARAVPPKRLRDGLSGHATPRLLSMRRCRWRQRRFSRPAPIQRDSEEAGDVVHDLAGALVGEVAPDARLPHLPGANDLLARVIVVCSVETFHRRPHGRFRRSVLLAPGLGIPPMTLDPKGFASSGVPISGIAGHALQRGTSSSGIVNLWLLPARITSLRLPPLATSQAIE